MFFWSDITSRNYHLSGSLFIKAMLSETTFCLLWYVFCLYLCSMLWGNKCFHSFIQIADIICSAFYCSCSFTMAPLFIRGSETADQKTAPRTPLAHLQTLNWIRNLCHNASGNFCSNDLSFYFWNSRLYHHLTAWWRCYYILQVNLLQRYIVRKRMPHFVFPLPQPWFVHGLRCARPGPISGHRVHGSLLDRKQSLLHAELLRMQSW